MSEAAPSQLSFLGREITVFLIGTSLTIVSALIALIALALALDAVLMEFVSPALALGGTATVFAAVSGVLAVFTPKLLENIALPGPVHMMTSIGPAGLELTIEVVLTIIAALVAAARRSHQSHDIARR
jgi:hypothetical protein